MRTRHAALITVTLFLLVLPRAFGCSCANGTPIQKSATRYNSPEAAVFTARIVQLIGMVYTREGKRMSSQALAIVHERYWGLPWYWPRIVLLDGSYPCDTVLREGEEYLVAGHREGYGVVAVNLCSRTQPLKTAQVDLRTLDGTHCAAPGGTIIGHVTGDWDSTKREYTPAKVDSIAYSDINGRTYRASVDGHGVYELRHLPSVWYAPVSRLDDHQYVSSNSWRYQFTSLFPVYEGLCAELNLRVRDYQLTGRLLPGLHGDIQVELLNVEPGSTPVRADSGEPDGRFYFSNLIPGKYLLSVVANVGNMKPPRIFYPGVTDRTNAKLIDVRRGTTIRSYDFDPRLLPVVPIPVVIDQVAGSERFSWDIQIAQGNYLVNSSRAGRMATGVVFGMKGESYRLHLYGSSSKPLEYNDCNSDSVTVKAVFGMAPVHITAACIPE